MLMVEQEKQNESRVGISYEPEIRPTMTIGPEQMEELRTTLQVLAGTDESFRSALTQNPREIIAALIRMNSDATYDFQRGLDVGVLEQPANALFLVVPSYDKVADVESPIARVSMEAYRNTDFRSALASSPRETLEAFLKESSDATQIISADKEISVYFEDSGELLLVVPQASMPDAASISSEELFASGQFEEYMSCSTCECSSARTCSTGACSSASSCSSWSSSC